jgi:hypothetical protein
VSVPTDSGSNAEGLAQLNAMIARVRGLPVEVVEQSAKDIAKLVRAELAASISAGKAPDGAAWAQRKADGGKPLANAMNAIQIGVAEGPVVFAYLTGPEARHHRGWVRGGVKRPIIPTDLPPNWAPKIQAILARNFQRAAAGGGGNGK